MISRFIPARSLAIHIAAILLLLPRLALSQPIPEIAPEIVSAWKLNGGDALLIFRYDGTYFQIQDDESSPGMERGTFTWDKTSSAFSATTLRDTNGESGLSHPSGATTLAVSGNTLTYTVASEGSFTFSRVVNTASAIVGSWFIPGDPTTVTFLADGTYYNTEEEDDAPSAFDGMERGTYTWNPTTGLLTATPDIDTNGADGLSDLDPAYLATISGNAMTVPDDQESRTYRRLTQIPTPLNVKNDFEVDQFSNYQQTSAANPSLLPVPVPIDGDFPFWGEAYIENTVSGTAGTLTIAGQEPRPFSDDDGWGIETEYTTLNALNASSAFPNDANYVFARTGGSAILSFPAGGTFPTAPKITRDDIIANTSNEDGAWIAGEYVLAQNQTLIWEAHTNYDPTTLVTVLSVVDQDTQEELFYETVIQGDINSYDFSGKLTPGRAYDVQLEHVKIAGSTTSGTGPFAGKLGYAFYNSNTRFTMVASGEPTSTPTITQQPVSQLPAEATQVILTVGTDGEDRTLTYQWFKDDEPIPGQTGNSLTIRNYSTIDHAGSYTAQVTNSQGSVTSDPATLGETLSEIKYVFVGKSIEYKQTGPSTVIVNPRPVDELYGGPYGFDAVALGLNLESIPAPIVDPPAGTPTTGSDPFYESLFYNEEDGAWNYGPGANNWGATSQLEIDTKFPNGTYTFQVNGGSIPLELTGDAYPNTPQLTLTGGSWVNGKYAIASSATLTATTNVFQQYTTYADGLISLWVDGQGRLSFADENPETNSLTYSVAASELQTAKHAKIEVEFEAVVDQTRFALGIDYAEAVYGKELEVEVHVLPEITSQSSSLVVSAGIPVNLQITAIGTSATLSGSLDYQWKRNGVNLTGKTSPGFSIPSFTVNDAATYTCTVSNDVGSTTSQPIHLEFADAFQTYAASYGLNSVTTGAPDGDFDKDSIPNLLEYLLGGNPTLPSSGLLPIITKAPGSNNLVFTYKRKIAATGVTQAIEHTTDLSNAWSTAIHGQNGVTIATTPVVGDATSEQFTVIIPSVTPSRFVRLRASR